MWGRFEHQLNIYCYQSVNAKITESCCATQWDIKNQMASERTLWAVAVLMAQLSINRIYYIISSYRSLIEFYGNGMEIRDSNDETAGT